MSSTDNKFIAGILMLAIVFGLLLWPQKLWWKGLYVGQSRTAAHAATVRASRYQSPYGGEPSYCIADLEKWGQTQVEQLVYACLIDEDRWLISSQCAVIGRPCSESIEIWLERDRVRSIRVVWGFMP